MFGSAVCEVALGLMVTYTAFGGTCSALREFLARLTSARENQLIAAVYRLLGSKRPTGPLRETYANLDALSKLDEMTDVEQRAEAFAATGLAKLVMGHPLVRNLAADIAAVPSYLPSRNFALALLDVLVPDRTVRTVQAVKAVVCKLEPSARAALLPLVDDAGDDVTALQTHIERYFDDAMDRASGWYKRHTQRVIFLLALLLAIAANVDTIHLASELWRSPSARQQVVTTAVGAVGSGGASLLATTQFPLGWRDAPNGSLVQWAMRALGWLISAMAMTMGGSFWFDLLSRFVNLRATGPTPPRGGARN